MRRVRVLIVGECSATLASMFVMAGADAATCDKFKPSESKTIPHFQGDSKWVSDMGWDLIINHPPCQYLTNAGVSILQEEGRVQKCVHAAAVYRHMRSAHAAYVANENPKMHKLAQQLTRRGQVQFVQPWQNGTPHTKATGFETKANYGAPPLPALQPTCVVEGREHAMANLPETSDRPELRSRTYIGIAMAIAAQWMPTLVEYVSTRAPSAILSAASMVEQAQTLKHKQAAKIAFITRINGRELVLSHVRTDGDPTSPVPSLDLPGGIVEDHETVADGAKREANEELEMNCYWRRQLTESVESHPLAHASHTVFHQSLHNMNVWAVPIDPNEAMNAPFPTTVGAHCGAKEMVPGSLRWRPLEEVIAAIDHRFPVYAATVSEAVQFVTQAEESAKASMENQVAASAERCTTRPWMEPRPPKVEWSAPPQHVSYLHGKWRAWGLDPSAPGKRRYRWIQVSTELDQSISEELRPMPRTALDNLPIQEDNERANGAIGEALSEMQACHVAQKWERLCQAPMDVATIRAAEKQEGWKRLRSVWTQVETVMKESETYRKPNYLGLGWVKGDEPTVTSGVPTSGVPRGANAKQRAWFVRLQFEKAFVRQGHYDDPPAYDPTEENARVNAVEYSEAEVNDTTELSPSYRRNCLYVKGLSVCRYARTGKKSDKRYMVDVAMTIAKSLADTGAGPSIVTTELLAALPDDACVSRDMGRRAPPTQGPDGNLLRTHGYATLVFDLNGAAMRHQFMVVEGKPLLILGNDFLDHHKAELSLNQDGQGNGTISLVSSSKGPDKLHTVRVTVDPDAALQGNTVALAMEGDNTPPITVITDDTGETAAQGDWDYTQPTHESLPQIEKPSGKAGAFVERQFATDTKQHMLYSEKPILIPARSRVTAWLKAPLEFKGRTASYMVTPIAARQSSASPGLVDDVPAVECRVVTPDVNHRVPITFWNTRRRPVNIPAWSPVATIDTEFEVFDTQSNETVSLTYDELNEAQKALVDSVRVDPENRLSSEQKLLVRNMLARNVTALALDPKDPGHTHVMEVELTLKADAVPHRHAPSRVGEAGREIIEKHIAEMESRGIIRKSNSAWSSRIVLVKKKGGETRFCIDYRDTNSKLKYLDSPIPLTVEALDRMSSGQGDPSSMFLSTLDLASGFWCLPIKEEDKGITAFSSGRAKYEFNYLPFGIQSGPSYMCRLMDAVLDGLAWEVCIPYLDDIGAWSTGTGDTPEIRESNSFDQMMERMELIFERLRGANMTCKASKCVLFATETEYLGHIVGRGGLKMDPAKITKVKEIVATSINTLERVRSFLGLCSYYRRFIRGFSKIAAPLTDLTQKGVDVEAESQKKECQEAIELLKNAITSEPVLAAPRFDRMFKVKTDGAQTEGLGGVLGQDDDEGFERVIAYYARRLNKAERNYTITEIELLAAIESIRHWRPYLWGRKFKLIVDHAALKWLHTLRDTIEGGPASRLMRWILKLSEYNFEVEHKPGAIHSDADGMSRLVANIHKHYDELSDNETRIASALIIAAATEPTDHESPTATALTGSRPGSRSRKTKRHRVVTARSIQAEERTRRAAGTTKATINASYLRAAVHTPWKDAQKDDAECRSIYAYLDQGTLPPIADTASLKQSRWIIRATKCLCIRDGLICHEHPVKFTLTPFIPSELRWALMVSMHVHLGHMGQARMTGVMCSRYYWPGMQQSIYEFVRECHECTLAKPPTRRDRTSRRPPVGSYPFDLLVCDILDMEKTADYTPEGNGYSKVVVFVDSLSKWVEAIPVHHAPSQEEVLDIFLEHVMCRHGAPRSIMSDMGSNLCGQLCREIYEQTGVQMLTSAAEHHEAVGAVERFQQTLVYSARATDEGGAHWADHLPFLLMSYRATPHRVTRKSPAEILYGRELRLPAQLADPAQAAERAIDPTYLFESAAARHCVPF